MSTSVHLVVALMPLVLTLWAATPVPVIQDTQEMDLPVQVCKLNLMIATQFFVLEHKVSYVHTYRTSDGIQKTLVAKSGRGLKVL